MDELAEIPAVIRNDSTDNYRALDAHLQRMGVERVVDAVLEGRLAVEAIQDPILRDSAVRAWQTQQAELMQEVREVQQEFEQPGVELYPEAGVEE